MVGKKGRPNIKSMLKNIESLLHAFDKRLKILEEINGITPGIAEPKPAAQAGAAATEQPKPAEPAA